MRKDMHSRKIIYSLLLCPLFLSASVCYFSPPKDWECSLPKNLSPHVKIGFVAPEISSFRPSINLALEKVEISLPEYLKAVKQIHLSQPNTQWRDLGAFQVQAGEGRLTEISNRSVWGEIKMLQAIFIQEQTAYILTAAVLKKDFAKQHKVLLQALQSLCLTPNLYAALPQERQKLQFKQFFDTLVTFSEEEKSDAWKKNQWAQLQTIINEECSDMGTYWQFLALQEGYQQIYNPEKK